MSKITFEEWKNFIQLKLKESQAKGFINVWDIYTGKANSEPEDLTFYYKKGDYFIITTPKKKSNKKFSIYLPCGNHYPQKEEIKTNKLKDEAYAYIYMGNDTWIKEIIPESPFAIPMVE